MCNCTIGNNPKLETAQIFDYGLDKVWKYNQVITQWERCKYFYVWVYVLSSYKVLLIFCIFKYVVRTYDLCTISVCVCIIKSLLKKNQIYLYKFPGIYFPENHIIEIKSPVHNDIYVIV